MRALAIFATASVLALPLAATAAPDCDGGRVYSLRLRPDRIRFHASLTRRGVTHDTLVTAPGGLRLEIFDADDPAAVLYSTTIPSDRFAPRRRATSSSRSAASCHTPRLASWCPTRRRRPACASTIRRTACRRTRTPCTSTRPIGTRSTASARDR